MPSAATACCMNGTRIEPVMFSHGVQTEELLSGKWKINCRGSGFTRKYRTTLAAIETWQSRHYRI